MIAALKEKLWGVVNERQVVSLVMIFDRGGRILWHRGRPISGNQVGSGAGYPQSLLSRYLESSQALVEENAVITSEDALSRSARILNLKTVLILPLSGDFSLYLDSGSRDAFSEQDMILLRTLGELLASSLHRIERDQEMPGGIVGQSEMMNKVRKLLLRYAIEEDPILLTGETGVGKNHIAELIHAYSGRKGRLVTVLAPSLPETLIESELFGSRKGAFTGASENRQGLVAEAEGGTLFLDEVSEISPNFQAKLLQFIDKRTYRPVGANRLVTADVRIIAASNQVLSDAVRQGRFRQDLFYRLNVLPIEIPPLRERKEDIPLLVEALSPFLRGHRLDSDCLDLLCAHPWYGNVRELIQVLKRCGLMCDDLTPNQALKEILAECRPELIEETEVGSDLFEHYDRLVESGHSFWQGPWHDFMERRLNRGQLQFWLARRFQGMGSLKGLAEGLNLSPGDYPRFVSALHKYGIHPGRRGAV